MITENSENNNLSSKDSTNSSPVTTINANWQPLVNSNIPPERLLLGDFNGDGEDDVLTNFDGNFQVSYSGNSSWQPLINSNIGVEDLLVGDLNGDGADDVFTTFDGNFQVSYNATDS